MKIGIISEGYGEDSLELLVGCDEVIVLPFDKVSTNDFNLVIREHLADDIMIPSVEAIGLQLVQLLPSLKVVAEHDKILHFIQKDQSNLLSDDEYFFEIYHLALLEETIIKKRTVVSIRKAQEKGIVVGRPTIGSELIDKIYRLYNTEKKTIREIAFLCDVSIGTAFKYSKV
ncbi:recombinase family protein [Vagococcus sp. BWB3-3]|uniref:Recombinase family protein n=1 Tax=Vagococcus allomyrinae TaxID=2794353 RepID=A0A940PFE4_9ENTE|nr:recombinase family protein [Vagococcus allomyrinae]MBP1043592.1 recombinase family protein [Vagococcus allomyrinae]